MDNNSSRGSHVSLTESEISHSDYSNRHARGITRNNFGNNPHTHKYNTRLSVRRSSTLIEPPLKKLYVDLSNSQIEPYRHHFQVLVNTQQTTNQRQRRESTCSQDSREFDFGCQELPKPLQFRYNNMFEVNPCAPRNNWLKYFILLCLTAFMYVYIRLISNTDIILTVHNELLKLKMNFEDTRFKLSQVEMMARQLKHDHAKFERNLHKIISTEIEIFSSDKTGRTDFALESTGGRIMHLSPGTENFEQAVSVLGMKLCDGKHGPRAMIQADMSPGHCWAIKGGKGGVVIKLLGSVKINAVSMEHISKNLSPTGEISSAPKNFSVWGLNMPKDRGTLLGEFGYNADGPLVQTFSVKNVLYFDLVEFRVLSNQGNPEYTCIYRFRVHGSLEKIGGR